MAKTTEDIERIVKALEKRMALKERQEKEASAFREASRKTGESIRAEKELRGQ